MNTLIFLGLFMCVFVAYTSALPYPSEVVAETESKGKNLVAIDTAEGESLIPAESARRGHGWGHGGGGGGWGHGGGGGGWGHGGHGGGWGHGGHHGHHHGHHHGGWGR